MIFHSISSTPVQCGSFTRGESISILSLGSFTRLNRGTARAPCDYGTTVQARADERR